MAMRFGLRRRDREKIITEYHQLKEMGAICEIETEEGERVFLVKFFGNIYVNPYTYDAYTCEVIIPGRCKCEYSEIHTTLVKKAATEGIRLL